MSEQVNISSPPVKRHRRLGKFILGTGLTIVLSMFLGLLLYITVSGLADLDSRLTQLEGQQNGVVHIDEIGELQKRVEQLSVASQQNSQSLAALGQSLTRSSGQVGKVTALEKTLHTLTTAQQALDNRLTMLNEHIERLKQAKPSPQTPAINTIPATTKTPVKPVSRMTRKAPFVLTGVEMRGMGPFAALAPRGYSSLAQIYLIAEGETVSGWTLVQAGQRQAKFRVNGRLITIGVEE